MGFKAAGAVFKRPPKLPTLSFVSFPKRNSMLVKNCPRVTISSSFYCCSKFEDKAPFLVLMSRPLKTKIAMETCF